MSNRQAGIKGFFFKPWKGFSFLVQIETHGAKKNCFEITHPVPSYFGLNPRHNTNYHLTRPHESREKLRRNETGYPVLQTPHRILLRGNRSKYPTRPSFPAGRFVLVSRCFIFRKAMVLVMMSILMHMMAAGSLSGMEHGVHPITTNLGNQVSILQGFSKKNSVIRNLKIGQIEAFRHFLRTANVKK